jgi:thiol-disulfide isomerase/thioredoxin
MSAVGLCLALLSANPPAAQAAQETRPLQRGGYQQILAARAGKPFIVAFWSVNCTYCGAELAMFGKLLKKYRSLNLVLVSTDAPADEAEIAATLNKHALGRAESWVFADTHVERLRFEVDPEWYGELPRTYFFALQGGMKAASGKLEQLEVERWIDRQHGLH